MHMTEADIRRTMDSLLAAWRARDPDRYLAHFAEHADVVNRGGHRLAGREQAGERFRWMMTGGLPAMFTAEHTIESIRALTPDVVLVHERRTEPERVSVAAYTLVRHGDRWLVESVSISPVQPAGQAPR